jgi:hypothetical protein
MNWLQFGNNEDVDVGGGHTVFKMQSHRFAYIFVKFVDSFTLRENIFADAPGAPKVTVVIDFDFYQHRFIIRRLGATGQLCFVWNGISKQLVRRCTFHSAIARIRMAGPSPD